MEQQTAVEWLSENIPDLGKYIPFGVSMELHAKFQQAKQMEKQQIIDAWCDGNDSDPKETTGHYAEIYFKDIFKN